MEEQEQQQTISQAQPELLYHYTTLDGLLGILGKKELWATGISYLNDTSEYEAGTNAVFQLMFPMSSDVANASTLDSSDFFDQLRTPFDAQQIATMNAFSQFYRLSAKQIFTASFSAEKTGDDLSQWRAYGGQHSGISLGFSPQYLRGMSRNFLEDKENPGWVGLNEAPLTKCKYYGDTGVWETNPEIQNRIREIEAQQTDSESKSFLFARYAATLKHEKFHLEKEWRIVLTHRGADVPNSACFRRANSMIVPYVRIPLAWSGQPVEIDRIVVGPTPHKEKAKESIEMLLKSNHVKFSEVVNSRVPFRNW